MSSYDSARASRIPANKLDLTNLSFPTVTHLQWGVLAAVATGPRLGVEIRALLLQLGQEMEGPKFYLLMGRMRESGLVLETKVSRMGGSQERRESKYTISKKGRAVFERSLIFYLGVKERLEEQPFGLQMPKLERGGRIRPPRKNAN